MLRGDRRLGRWSGWTLWWVGEGLVREGRLVGRWERVVGKGWWEVGDDE